MSEGEKYFLQGEENGNNRLKNDVISVLKFGV